jgi:hypothetical protein
MAPVLTDPAERRLRAARPPAADVADDAATHAEALELLARVRIHELPISSPRSVPRRGRVAVAVALAILLVVVLGVPGSGDGPQNASARPIVLALRWFAPAPGTVLHIRSTLVTHANSGPSSTTEETWQSVDHPDRRRISLDQNGIRVESGPDGLYDPARNTIYDAGSADMTQGANAAGAVDQQLALMRAQGVSDADIAAAGAKLRQAAADRRLSFGGPELAGDDTVTRIRKTLEKNGARLAGREMHDGVDAYAISLVPDTAESVRWTLWLAASNGRPLELRVDDGPGRPPVETTTWPTYELLSGHTAADLVTLSGAHPDARVVHDAGELAAAAARLYKKG